MQPVQEQSPALSSYHFYLYITSGGGVSPSSSDPRDIYKETPYSNQRSRYISLPRRNYETCNPAREMLLKINTWRSWPLLSTLVSCEHYCVQILWTSGVTKVLRSSSKVLRFVLRGQGSEFDKECITDNKNATDNKEKHTSSTHKLRSDKD